MKTLVVIPARFASTRFPGKPLALIDGRPMIQHVYENSKLAAGITEVIVATEDQRIVEACKSFGANVEMTSQDHTSGTDRVAEVALRHAEYEAVLNVQGDEPAMEPDTIQSVALALRESQVQISSAMTLLTDEIELASPNVVKAVTAKDGDALYFSRAAIPYLRDNNSKIHTTYFRHLGIYGFRREVLHKITKLRPSMLELAESLEQLRWLEAGYKIRLQLVKSNSFGIDTPQDLNRLSNLQSQAR